MINWRIYYADYSTFDSSQGEPQDAPGTGVIVIDQQNPLPNEKPYIQHMTDYYIWLGTHWLGCDLLRLYQYWFVDGHKYDFPRASLAGETVMNEDYLAIRKKAKRDPDFFEVTE
jgi:hypothetical protein